jgi:hypothetical protein
MAVAGQAPPWRGKSDFYHAAAWPRRGGITQVIAVKYFASLLMPASLSNSVYAID